MNDTNLSPAERVLSVRRLWEECFDDTNEFVDLYFARVYPHSFNFSVEKDGRVVTALQCIPHHVYAGGKRMRTCYISGVCTAQKYRHLGLAGGLVSDALRNMGGRKCALAFLIPAGRELIAFYRRFGFAPALKRAARSVPHKRLRCNGDAYELERVRAFDRELYSLFVQRRSEHSGYVLVHSRRAFETVVIDWILGGNDILAARCGGKRVSYAMIRPDQSTKTLYVYDAPAANCPAFDFLLHAAAEIYCGYKLKTVSAMHNARDVYACVRVVDARGALATYAALHPATDMRIRVKDDKIIARNNRLFVIKSGKCHPAKRSRGNEVCMNVEQLARFLFRSDTMTLDFMLE